MILISRSFWNWLVLKYSMSLVLYSFTMVCLGINLFMLISCRSHLDFFMLILMGVILFPPPTSRLLKYNLCSIKFTFLGIQFYEFWQAYANISYQHNHNIVIEYFPYPQIPSYPFSLHLKPQMLICLLYLQFYFCRILCEWNHSM